MSPFIPNSLTNITATSNNPLQNLENNGYNVTSFTYPIDLCNDPGENHMVVFHINQQNSTQFPTNTGSTNAINSGLGSFLGGNVAQLNNAGTLPQLDSPTSNSTDNVTTFNNAPISRVATTIA